MVIVMRDLYAKVGREQCPLNEIVGRDGLGVGTMVDSYR